MRRLPASCLWTSACPAAASCRSVGSLAAALLLPVRPWSWRCAFLLLPAPAAPWVGPPNVVYRVLRHARPALAAWLQVIDFPDAEGPLEFSYDEEWLAVLRSTHGLLSLQRRAAPLPRGGLPPPVGEGELAEVRRRLAERGGGGEGAAAAVVPRNFVASVPAFDPDNPQMRQGRMPQVGGMARREGVCACLAGRGSAGGGRDPCICSQLALPACHPRLAAQHAQRNPQTEAFLGMLGLPYNLDHDAPAAAAGGGGGYGGGGFGGFGGGAPGGYGSGLAAAAAGMGPAVAIGGPCLAPALLRCGCCPGAELACGSAGRLHARLHARLLPSSPHPARCCRGVQPRRDRAGG